MTELAEIDRAIDGILVQLGQLVLRLSTGQCQYQCRGATGAGAVGQSIFRLRGQFR